ncbi:MAG TPA: mandelate racemase/muconate lactonizing enzyme family protein [Fimbriimonadaceae bacterium]|nr:mandelate racemase/muconate lactonizing enzyme family protein [Fimbriimonadaceae bacterium]
MRIVGIDVFQPTYRLLDGKYAWSNEHFVTEFTTTIVRVQTDQGIVGWGEVCPLGPAYMGAYARGVPAGIAEVAPAILGEDPLQIGPLNDRMDYALSGHNYAKSPIDMALWDILGKASGLPVCALLGGQYVDDFAPYRAISQDSPVGMAASVRKYRKEGYRKFQLKVGGDWQEDVDRIHACREVLEPGDILVADANTGWLSHEAIKVANAVAELDVYIEQPCHNLEECARVRNATPLPFVVDEIILGVPELLRAHDAIGMDVVNLKISRLGGLTKARRVRDLATQLGLAMTLEDSWGGDITTAAIAHLVASTRPENYFSATDFNSYNDVRVAGGTPRRKGGLVPVPSGPGLGIEVEESLLGEPVRLSA